MSAAEQLQKMLSGKEAGAFSPVLEIRNGGLIAVVAPKQIVPFLTFLRDDKNLLFQQLMDVTGADYPEREKRFEVVYQLLSLRHNRRLMVKICAGEGESVPSVTKVFSSAGWYEREAFDLYGVSFSGHPDLRRILTDYNFEGHPLRKDFPLTGYVEVRYDEEQKKVVYAPVKLDQEFRTFDFEMPWKGTQYRLQDAPNPAPKPPAPPAPPPPAAVKPAVKAKPAKAEKPQKKAKA